MSYDIDLTDPVTGAIQEFDAKHQMRGGTYAVGGTAYAALNITYNYSDRFRRVLGKLGIRRIYGMTGAESLPVLAEAIASLGDEVSDDYWQSTDGNAKGALHNLRAMAAMRPDGIWRGD